MPTQFATLLLTRPQEMHAKVLSALAPLPEWLEVVATPLLEISATGDVPDLAPYAGVIFTSRNGVRFAGPSHGRPTYCVGPETADVATATGWQVAHIAQDADALVQNLITLAPAGPLLHICGAARRGEIAERLTDSGLLTRIVTVYEQSLLPLSASANAAIVQEMPVIVPLYSPRTAQQFAKEARNAQELHIVCLSDAVRAEVNDLPYRSLSVAAEPNGERMLQAVRNVLRRVETAHAPK